MSPLSSKVANALCTVATMHSVTDGQTYGRTDGRQDYANSRSYCVVVRSAKREAYKMVKQLTGGFDRVALLAKPENTLNRWTECEI